MGSVPNGPFSSGCSWRIGIKLKVSVLRMHSRVNTSHDVELSLLCKGTNAMQTEVLRFNCCSFLVLYHPFSLQRTLLWAVCSTLMGWVQLVCPPALTLNSTRGCPTLRSPSARVHQVRSLFHPNRPILGSAAAPTPGWRVVPIITWVSCLSRQSTGWCLSVANHRAAWHDHKFLHQHTNVQAPTRTPLLSPDSRKGERHVQTLFIKQMTCLCYSLVVLEFLHSHLISHL